MRTYTSLLICDVKRAKSGLRIRCAQTKKTQQKRPIPQQKWGADLCK